MPSFIQALVALAMSVSASFTHGGKPAVLPVASQENIVLHGGLVSQAAMALDPQNENSLNAGANIQGNANASSQAGNAQSPDTTRVAADNIRAGIQMPALIPQVALDHSSALEVSAGVFPTPGQGIVEGNAQVNAEISSHANFGQGIANSQPDTAKADGQAFGQFTAQFARGNSHRP